MRMQNFNGAAMIELVISECAAAAASSGQNLTHRAILWAWAKSSTS